MFNIEEIIEAVELAEECALAELGAFGVLEFEDGTPAEEWNGEEYRAAAWQQFNDCGRAIAYGLL